MSRFSNLERIIRGSVAFQVAAAAAQTASPSLDTTSGILRDGEKVELPVAKENGSSSSPRQKSSLTSRADDPGY